MKLNKIKNNKNNPRFIRDEKFAQLKQSIVNFPEMLKRRPIVVDENSVALGGNMRLEAIRDLHKTGFEEIYPANFTEDKTAYRRDCYRAILDGELRPEWVAREEDFDEAQKQEFVIKDNIAYGNWDDDILANSYTDLPLTDWGLDFISPSSIDMDGFFENSPKIDIEEKHVISLSFGAEEFNRVSPALLKYGKTYEQAVWSLLGL